MSKRRHGKETLLKNCLSNISFSMLPRNISIPDNKYEINGITTLEELKNINHISKHPLGYEFINNEVIPRYKSIDSHHNKNWKLTYSGTITEDGLRLLNDNNVILCHIPYQITLQF